MMTGSTIGLRLVRSYRKLTTLLWIASLSAGGAARENAILAVERETVLRAEDIGEALQFLLARVSRDVRPALRVVNHLRAELEEVVDCPRDELLVTGDGRCRHDRSVALFHRDMAVVAERHPRERAGRLALASGRDDAELVVGELADLVRADDGAFRILEVAKFARRLGVVLHRAADDRGLSTPRGSDLDDLADARDVRCECGRDHAARRARHDGVEHLGHVALRLRVT